MKVAILGSLPLEHGGTGIGGLSVHTAQISRHLVRQGVEVDVAAWNIPSSSPQRITSPDGYEIHRLATIRSKETVAQLMRRFPGMIRLPVPGSQALSLRHRLAVLLLATVFVRNLYCRYLCSVGAGLGRVVGGAQPAVRALVCSLAEVVQRSR